jgi:hypothetical protein
MRAAYCGGVALGGKVCAQQVAGLPVATNDVTVLKCDRDEGCRPSRKCRAGVSVSGSTMTISALPGREIIAKSSSGGIHNSPTNMRVPWGASCGGSA